MVASAPARPSEIAAEYVFPSIRWDSIQRERKSQRALVATAWPIRHLPKPDRWPLEASVERLLQLTPIQINEVIEIRDQARNYLADYSQRFRYRPERRASLLRIARDGAAHTPVTAALNQAGNEPDLGGTERAVAHGTVVAAEVLLSLYASACQIRNSLYRDLDEAFGKGNWLCDDQEYDWIQRQGDNGAADL